MKIVERILLAAKKAIDSRLKKAPAVSSYADDDAVVIALNNSQLCWNSKQELFAAAKNAWKLGARKVVLDMSNVESIDTMGISLLYKLHSVRPAGTTIVASNLCDNARNMFEVTSLFKSIEVYQSVKPALQRAFVELN
jgi:anti-anti-sigma factor